ncbi:type IV conjugative transfer system protein TraL [Photobacterium sp. R1]
MDEVVPPLIIFLVFFAGRHEAVGFFLAASWYLGLHSMKKKHGDNVVRLTLFWYAPSKLSKNLFNKTPSPVKRYWIH